MLRCCGSRRPTSRCLTTSSSSASRSLPPTAWWPRRAASFTSTDARGHQCLYGSALPYHGGGARGEVAQAGRGPGENGRDAGRGRDRQGRDGSGGARGRRAAAGRRRRGPDRCGRERGGGDRRARRDSWSSGRGVGRRNAGGGRREAGGGRCGRGSRRRNAREGFAPRQTHGQRSGRRSPARHRLGTGRTSRQAGPGGCSAPRVSARRRSSGRRVASRIPHPEVTGAPFEDVPLTQIRKTIAKRLAASLGPIPHFFLTTEVDMERASEARDALNRQLGDQGGGKVSFNDIVIKAVAIALTKHRACNAWFQEDHIRYWHEVHIGMAVAVEDGLITPVIRNAERKSLADIGREAKELAEKARSRRLQPSEYTGSTFSVSNLGMFDIDQFTAVINPPEAGIIAVGSIVQKPVVVDEQLTPRRRMRITMSCDHRVIDGATGAAFLRTLKQMLENPLAMLL